MSPFLLGGMHFFLTSKCKISGLGYRMDFKVASADTMDPSGPFRTIPRGAGAGGAGAGGAGAGGSATAPRVPRKVGPFFIHNALRLRKTKFFCACGAP